MLAKVDNLRMSHAYYTTNEKKNETTNKKKLTGNNITDIPIACTGESN